MAVHVVLGARILSHRPSMSVIGLLVLYVLLDAVIFKVFVPGADWAPLWVAGQLSWTSPGQAYDFELVSFLQRPLVEVESIRPFVYPPSALLVFTAFAVLPFTASFVFFILVSLAMFSRASSPLRAQIALLLFAPPVVLAATAGQPTLLVTALILFGLVQLERHEGWAGVLFGIAAMIKPPLLLLAPVALAGGGYWRAFAAAGVSAIAMGAVSVAAFGFDTWLVWFSVLPLFNELVTEFEPLLRNAITPYAMAVRTGFAGNIVIAGAAVIAIPVAWLSFARTRDISVRLVALVGGALLVSPYAMNYELAALAPAVAASRMQKPTDVITPAIWAASLFVSVSLAGLLAVYAWAVSRLVAQWRTGGNLPMQTRAEAA
ncbi:DUF2029 domain-containing protein [Erythrobacter sp. NFXS35]|uniref:glycosyltransferase family 87 protein n=1 Tax=Erythrobacter sp. NFXS35 TaxID=2818436 RepID=UPI0032DF5EC8